MRKTMKIMVVVLCIVLCMSVFFACDKTHEHKYALKSDSTNHWYECADDGDVKADSTAPHTDEDRNGKCDVCGHDVIVTNLKGITFAISGQDGTETVSLNGVAVTIQYKNNTFTATIADGKFVTSEIVPLGTYTVSAEGYNNASINITKDGVAGAVVLTKKVTVQESVTIETVQGVPTLVVKGMLPDGVGNIKVHADAEFGGVKHHYFWDNTSTIVGAYEVNVPLTDLPNNNDTPWCWFHVYAYAETAPADDATPLATKDLPRGDALNIGDRFDYNGIRYTVQDQNQVCIQPTVIPTTVVTSVAFDVTGDKPLLVVKGTIGDGVKCVKLHANAGGNDNKDYHVYGDNVSEKSGEFEIKFDLSQIVSNNKWAWFHLYTYDVETPADNENGNTKIDFKREWCDFTDGQSVDFGGIRYTVQKNADSWGMLTIAATPIPTTTVTSIAFDTTGAVPALVVKGTLAENVPCAKMHIWSAKGEKVWQNLSSEAGKFEFRAPLTDFPTDDTPYCYFHLWTYEEANAADDANHNETNLPRNNLIKAGARVDYNNVRYQIVADNNLVLWPTTIPTTGMDVESIAFEEIGGEQMLVVRGNLLQDVPCVKLHADGNGNHHYWNNVATEGGKFEFRAKLSDLEVEGTPWFWFHIYCYETADAENGASHVSVNLNRNGLIAKDTHVEQNNIRYTVIDQGQVCIQPTNA